jgi:prephenate dehydrogenase
MIVGIIGLGLIGGSLAMSLKKRGFASKIIGVDKSVIHCQDAVNIGFVDETCLLNEVLDKVDIVILAIPVDAGRQLLPLLLDTVKTDQVFIDMGSTKEGICKVANEHHNRKNFVASHPIAGTENAGPFAAFDGLFDEKITIICDGEKSNIAALKLCNKLYSVLNMKILTMSAEEHDRHIAYVSHLSHITSFVLGQTVLEIEKEEKHIFNMAGSGFASTVRLAKSSPNMWAPIFEQNKEHLSNALDTYIKNLQQFKHNIDQGKKEDLHSLMSDVNDIRRVLKGL